MRSRWPLFVVAAVPLAATVIGARQATTPTTNPLTGDAAAVAVGHDLYAQICQACHGPGAQGTDRGPGLATSALLHGNADADLFRTVRNGVPGTQMAGFAALTDSDIWRIVAYVRTLQTSAFTTAGIATGDPAVGEALFFGKAECGTCHEVNGRGGIVGPELSAAGLLSTGALQQKIIDPDFRIQTSTRGARGAASPAHVIATTKEGRQIRGVRRNEDTFSLQMIDVSGQLHLLDKLTLASLVVDETSLHPRDYRTRLSESDIADVVAYLLTLRGRDPARTALVPPIPGGLTTARLLNTKSEPHNWAMYWGDYQGTHYSALSTITPDNVAELRAAWSAPVPGDNVSESTPLVVDGVMYATSGGSPRTVTAIDARTGRQIWRFVRPQKVRNPGETDVVNRGVAILGHRLFVGTNDAALLCLDARTGLLVWEVQVADTMEGFNITSPPLIVKDKIIVGHAGGEYALRGFLDAYDVNGKHLWRTYTIPAPGEPGNETWKGDSWKTGAGSTWYVGSYDAKRNLVYWSTSNGGPWGGQTRGNDSSDILPYTNLWTSAQLAFDGDTGKIAWGYQMTPSDVWDFDGVNEGVLADLNVSGQQTPVVMRADRNGFFYV